ncbi:MAG: hypothetical protein PWP24_1957, partial [Clostridiales bacterium]|nr:hypothetical protein [Clostridiales bacterium]
ALTPSMQVLEVGCGDGTFWKTNQDHIPSKIQIILSDQSDGMLRDARRSIGTTDPRFSFAAFDCEHIPYPDASFDLVVANHVLFYCQDIVKACKEAWRVLKPGGRFICSTYGSNHMKEVSLLVTEFDERIVLSADKLYQRFGRENGRKILSPFFENITWLSYEDALCIPDAEPLISYVLSCHGNQMQYLLDRYKEFQTFVKRKTANGFTITKDAGIFLCEKK